MYTCIQPGGVLYDAESNLSATAKFLVYTSSKNTLQNMTATKTIKVSAIRLLLSRSSSTCFSGQHGYTTLTNIIATTKY